MSKSSRLKTQELQAENTIEGYRQIDRLSYSDLKKFGKDKKEYYKLKVLKDVDAIEKDERAKAASPYIRMGNLIDIQLTDPANFHNLFVRTEASVPSGQMLTLTNFLFDYTVRDMEDGVCTSDFSSRFSEAYKALCESNGGSVKSKEDTFYTRFEVEGEEYFKEKLNSIGKTIITLEEEQKSDSIVQALKSSVGTRNEVLWQNKIVKYPILFDVYGLPMKMELDQGRIDDSVKKIYLDDYKVSSFIDNFQWNYLDDGYYLQSSLYFFGAVQHFNDHPKYKDYEVVPEFNFIVSDYNNYMQPLLYKVTEDNLHGGWTGFKVGNKRYKGILQLIEELQFSTENNLWDMSVENFRNQGKITIPNFELIES
jgi:hypothetical protein